MRVRGETFDPRAARGRPGVGVKRVRAFFTSLSTRDVLIVTYVVVVVVVSLFTAVAVVIIIVVVVIVQPRDGGLAARRRRYRLGDTRVPPAFLPPRVVPSFVRAQG